MLLCSYHYLLLELVEIILRRVDNLHQLELVESILRVDNLQQPRLMNVLW